MSTPIVTGPVHHLRLTVSDVERSRAFGVPHGEITDLGDVFGLYVLAFRDPDNIQLELTAAYS
jgi:hypothetical protein